jgi:hypothetical protein
MRGKGQHTEREMEIILLELTQSMQKVRIASKALQGEPGMEEHAASIREKMHSMSQDIKILRTEIDNFWFVTPQA